MWRALVISGVVAAMTPASAQAPVPSSAGGVALHTFAPSDYASALRLGRQQLDQNDFKQAVLSFETALKYRLNDPVALTELGWAIFLTGDLSRARQISAQAAELARDPKLRAASLYNVGRAAEAVADRSAAVNAYQHSFKLRPNPEVRARLAVLDPEVFAFEQNQPTPIAGTSYRSVEAFCKKWLQNPKDRCQAGFRKQWPFDAKYDLAKLPSPMKDLSVFHTYNDTGVIYFCQVSIAIGRKVFIQEIMTANNCLPINISVQDLGKGFPQAIAIWIIDNPYERKPTAPAGGMSYFVKRLTLCGVGRSGVPSCTLPFELERVLESLLEDTTQPARSSVSWEHKWRLEFDQPGTLRLTPVGWWPTDTQSLKQVGRHRIVFP